MLFKTLNNALNNVFLNSKILNSVLTVYRDSLQYLMLLPTTSFHTVITLIFYNDYLKRLGLLILKWPRYDTMMKFSCAIAYDVRYLLCRFRGFYIRVAWRFQDMPWRHLWRKIIEIKFKTIRLLYFKYLIFKVQPNDNDRGKLGNGEHLSSWASKCNIHAWFEKSSI